MTNKQAIAYAIIAMDAEGYEMDKIKEIVSAMEFFMDLRSEEETEELADFVLSEY